MPGELTEADWEQHALDWMSEWGWTPIAGPKLAPDAKSDRLERESLDSLVLADRLRDAIERINPDLPPSAVDQAMADVRQPQSNHPIAENFRIHQLLTRGVKVFYPDADGREQNRTAWLLDYEDPEANDLLVANQVTFKLPNKEHCRFDMVAYVNGLPLAILELKKADDPKASSKTAYLQLQTYLREFGVPAFAIPALVVASDGVTARVGTVFSAWEHFAPWNVDEWGSPVTPTDGAALEVLIAGVFDPRRFLDLLANFIEFSTGRDSGGVSVKKLAKAHQYFAVNKAVDATIRAVDSDGKAGVVWHTQGSGKSLEMAFYVAKLIQHERMANPTIVMLTDRLELDDQLFRSFAASKLFATPIAVDSRGALRDELARDIGGILFTTLHKFSLTDEERKASRYHPTLSTRRNIIVIADEAHRSHYDFIDGFARHLRDALPRASFIAFTGTPISSAERNTRAVFGDYIDIYDLTRAVNDGATVRVFYQNRHVPVGLKVDIDPDDLDERADEAIAALPESQRNKIQHGRQMLANVFGSPERLAKVARDIVEHWERRRDQLSSLLGVPGKGMIVCFNRRICADLYEEIVRLRPGWATDDDATGKIKVLYSASRSDEPPISYHARSKAANDALKRRATDEDDELELIIVANMLLTGFDSPPMHTLYLDKPMKGAALMQAITRVNRTFRGKGAGLVVDLAGITEGLTSALAEYTQADKEQRPIGASVAEAVEHVHEQHAVVCRILEEYDWHSVLHSGAPDARMEATYGIYNYLTDPVHAQNLKGQDQPDLAERFDRAVTILRRAFALCPVEEEVQQYRDDIEFFQSVQIWKAKLDADSRDIRGLPNPPEVEYALKQLASSAIAAAEPIDIFDAAGLEQPDITNLDKAFVERMQKSARPNLAIEALRRMIERQIRSTHRNNVVKQRGFSEQLLQAMHRYTSRAISSAEVINELVDLAKEINADKDRAQRLGLDEDELAFYDAVATNESAVRELGDDVLARIARDLVRAIRTDPVSVDWTVREQVQAKLRSKVKRLLAKHGYPPDAELEAIRRVLEQTQAYAESG